MTIPEACSLVLQAGGVGKNGTPYLLDMGEPIKILELAEQIIRFSGFEPYKDIDIRLTGPRRGERAVEPLWLPEEKPAPTEYPKILQLQHVEQMKYPLNTLLDKLAPVCLAPAGDGPLPESYRNSAALRQILADAVPSYQSFLQQEADHV